MKNQSVEINLLGQKTVLKTSGDPEEIREVVDLVSAKIKRAEERSKGQVPHHIALLALLELGEEYIQARKRFGNQKKKMEETTREIVKFMKVDGQ
jgi:cell division protein ZapA (FtsZ GTPase activity inhibitor)